MHAIGIDLGTTYSCVGVYQNGKVEIIANDQGNRITPSCVAFNDAERLVGEAAKNQACLNVKNTIFDAKRLMGRKYSDEDIQKETKYWPFKIVNSDGGGGDDDKPRIEITYKGELKKFSPEEISSMILMKMKETAEAYLGETITDAVITVPAYFNDCQRQATKDAGIIAGLNVLRIINEPTAAAISYGLNNNNNNNNKNILVFDLGGGTFDVSILNINNNLFKVKATSGDTRLGGEDFDNVLVNYFCQDIKKKFGKNEQELNKRAIARLKVACERIKRTLSSATEGILQVDCLFDGVDYSKKLTRARFDNLCNFLFLKTLDPVKGALQDAKLDKENIDEIILVGGSTRIPKIQNIIQNFFNGKSLNKSINPDEAVAYGAAIQAAVIKKGKRKQEEGGGGGYDDVLQDILLLDVTPLSLGVETEGEIMESIIERNTTIPAQKRKLFTTAADNQTMVKISIYQGEHNSTKGNHLLGEFQLRDIPVMKANEPVIEVTFDIDANGILKVSAIEKSSGRNSDITIDNLRGRLSKQQVENMINEAERFKQDEVDYRRKRENRNSLEQLCIYAKNNILNCNKEDGKIVEKKVDECLSILEEDEEMEEGREDDDDNNNNSSSSSEKYENLLMELGKLLI